MRFGPDATLPTSVAGRGFLDPDGVWRGDLYLRGGGDPTLGRDDLQRLAGAVGEAGILRVDGSVLGDESRFDSLRGSFDTGGAYDRDIGGVLGALTLNRGFSKDGKPAAAAAGQFAKALRGRRHPRRGPQRRRQRAGRRPGPGRRPLAADARPHPADQRPLRQLPGRDAAQGPRRRVRRRRHHRGRRRRGQDPAPEPRPDARRSSTAPGSRAPIAPPRARSCTCSRRCTARRSPARSRARLRWPGARGRSASACAAPQLRTAAGPRRARSSASARWRACATPPAGTRSPSRCS